MRNRIKKLLFTKVILLIGLSCLGQSKANVDSVVDPRFFVSVSKHAQSIEGKLNKKTKRILKRWERKEAKLKRKVEKIDSTISAKIFTSSNDITSLHLQEVRNVPYIPKIDSLATSFNFLGQYPNYLPQTAGINENLQSTLDKVRTLKEEFGKAEYVKNYLKQRKQFLKDQLSKLGFAKEIKRLNKEVFYYTRQINEYKDILNNSKKLERKTLELLAKTKLFRDFMRRNSQFASLFRLSDDPNIQANFAGLQTRAQVNNLIQQQIAAAGPAGADQFRQNVQAAQAQLNKLKATSVMRKDGSV